MKTGKAAITTGALAGGGRATAQQNGVDLSGLPTTALVLPAPHAEWIASGRKTLVVAARKFDSAFQSLLLADPGKVWGTVTLGKAAEITLEQFAELRDKHRITPKERSRWWPEKRKFWAYDVERVERFGKPVAHKFPGKAHVLVRDVVLKAVEGSVELTDAQAKDIEEAERLATRLAQLLPAWVSRYLDTVSDAGSRSLLQGLPSLMAALAKELQRIDTGKADDSSIDDVPVLVDELLRLLRRLFPVLPATPARILAVVEDSIRALAAFLGIDTEKAEPPSGRLPVLKVPDPAFNLALLNDKKPTGIFSRLRRRSRVGEPQFLVNEMEPYGGERAEASFVWGVVELEESTKYGSLADVPKKIREGVDTLSLAEFSTVKPVYYSPMELVAAYSPPVRLKGPPPGRRYGSEIEIDEWRAKAVAKFYSVEELEVFDPGTLSSIDESELIALDETLHDLYQRISPKDARARELAVNVHIFLLREFARRNLAHDRRDDDLDMDTRQFAPDVADATLGTTEKREYAPVNSLGNGPRGKVVRLDEVLSYIKPFQFRRSAICVVGGVVNRGETDGDIDLLIKGPMDAETRHVIEFRLGRMFPEDIRKRLSFLYDDDLGGPFTPHVELGDLEFVTRGEFVRIEMREATQKQGDPYMDLPPADHRKRDAVMQYHFRGKSLHLDFRAVANKHLIGWTLTNQRAGKVPHVDTLAAARKIAAGFSPNGDRYIKPFAAPSRSFATTKAKQPLAWLKIEGQVFGEGEIGATAYEEGVIVAADRPKVEFGTQKPFFHEYFLTESGKGLNGSLTFRLLTGQGKPVEGETTRTPEGKVFWTAQLNKVALPSVLRRRAVETESMPPDGYSAMPKSLMEVTPPEFRFWTAKGAEARAMRDALVASKFFTEENVRIVDKEFRRIVTKRYVDTALDTEEEETVGPCWTENLFGTEVETIEEKSSLPSGDKVIVCFSGGKDSLAALLWTVEKYPRQKILALMCDTTGEYRGIVSYAQQTCKRLGVSFRLVKSEMDFLSYYGQVKWRAEAAFCEYRGRHRTRPLINAIKDLARQYNNKIVVIEGSRAEESPGRRDRGQRGRFTAMKDVVVYRPSFYLTERDVWKKIRDAKFEPFWAYKAGAWRVGCWACPFTSVVNIAIVKNHMPTEWQRWLRAEKRIRARGKYPLHGAKTPSSSKRSLVSAAETGERRLEKSKLRMQTLIEGKQPVGKQARKAKFSLSWHWWKGPEVVRAGPSKQVWRLAVADSRGGLDTWDLQVDPLGGAEKIAAVYAHASNQELLSLEGNIEQGRTSGGIELNPTKATPSRIEIEDSGTAELIDDQPTFKKIRFAGKHLKGVHVLVQEDPKSNVWLFARGEAPGRAVAKTDQPAHRGKTFLEHAKNWVKEKGLLDKDSDYGGMLGRAVIRMAETFSGEGHSGMSAQFARACFNWICDAWDGLHTMMLNDEDYKRARAALAKRAVGYLKEITKAAEVEKVAPPTRDGIQIWDPKKKSLDTDRTQLRPPAYFLPMKPAPRETNEFRSVDEAVKEFCTPENLKAGIIVDPKINAFRFVMEKWGGELNEAQLLMFTERIFETKRGLVNLAPALPKVSDEARLLRGDCILDTEFAAFDDGMPIPRRELAEYRSLTPKDDELARLFAFRAVYLPGRNLTDVHELEARRALDRYLGGRKSKHIVPLPWRLVRTVAQARAAMQWALKYPGSEGAMLKLAVATYSLGGENDAWAKLRTWRDIRAIVYGRESVKDSPGVWNLLCAVGPVNAAEAEKWKDVVSVKGKRYVVIGKTSNTKVDARPGDVIRAEFTELMLDESSDQKSLTWYGPPVVLEKWDGAPTSLADALAKVLPGETKKDAEPLPIEIYKTAEERFILGVALEPNDGEDGAPFDPDTQRDIYSAADIRKTCHLWMERYQYIRVMHRGQPTSKYKLLENYIAPVDFDIEGKRVRKGTWLVAMRVVDDAEWEAVKRGERTGFSIGGTGVRIPVN